jgi:hypothetical protein
MILVLTTSSYLSKIYLIIIFPVVSFLLDFPPNPVYILFPALNLILLDLTIIFGEEHKL